MTEKGTIKDCGRHGGDRREWLWSRCLSCILSLIILILFVILIIYLILHPHKPRFYVQEASVRSFNLTNGNLLAANLEFTIISRNPNDRIGVFYDNLDAYAEYWGQQITGVCPQAPRYQGRRDITVFTFILSSGNGIPVAPFLVNRLNYDKSQGILNMNLRMDGRVRWKVGTWTSGHYHINVNCIALLGFDGSYTGGPVPIQPGTKCDVDV